MSRRNIRGRRGRRGELGKLLIAIGVLGIALVGAGIGVYVWATTPRPPARNQQTFCPLEGPRSLTVMLLDTSDDLPKPTRDEITKRLTELADEIPEHALLELRLLDPAVDGGKIVFSLCNPGNGEGLNEFTGNPSLAKRRWREKFREPLDRALSTGLQPHRTETSPILGTLQAIAIERFSGRIAAGVPKSLFIISDMIEHGKEYSQYRGDVSYDRFRKTPAYLKLRTDLNGAQVQILYVQRLSARIEPASHIRFWIDWIQDNKGTFGRAIRLQGAG